MISLMGTRKKIDKMDRELKSVNASLILIWIVLAASIIMNLYILYGGNRTTGMPSIDINPHNSANDNDAQPTFQALDGDEPASPSTSETESSVVSPEDLVDQLVLEQADNPYQVYIVTCYSPVEGFPETNEVCRGGTIKEWRDIAILCGLDGICAAGGETIWYQDAKDTTPPLVLNIDGLGNYLLVDRASRDRGVIDVWVPDLSVQYNQPRPIKVIGGLFNEDSWTEITEHQGD